MIINIYPISKNACNWVDYVIIYNCHKGEDIKQALKKTLKNLKKVLDFHNNLMYNEYTR
jgi:hypothetical protein